MTDFLSVLTCPLRTTLWRSTVDQLDAAGAGDPTLGKVLFCDGEPSREMLTRPSSWACTYHESGPSGTLRAMTLVFEYFLQNTNADRLIYCEDDLTVAPDAVNLIRGMTVPEGVGLISFFDWYMFETRVPDAVYCFGAGAPFRGTLCMLIPRRTIELFMETGGFRDWKHPDPRYAAMGIGCDVALGEKLHQLGLDYLIRIPNLVDHAGSGQTSIYVHDREVERRSANFRGST